MWVSVKINSYKFRFQAVLMLSLIRDSETGCAFILCHNFEQEDGEHIQGESVKVMRLGAHLLTFTVDCQGQKV